MRDNKNTEKSNTAKKHGTIIHAVFFTILFAVAIVGFALPLRETKSEREKRNYAQFPEFSWQTAASGQYFKDISEWYADSFPGKDSWVSLSKSTKELHGVSSNYIDLDSFNNLEVNDVKEDVVTSENIHIDAQNETETVEENPTIREEFTDPEVNVDNLDKMLYAGDFQMGDTVYSMMGFSEASSKQFVQICNEFSSKLKGTGINFYVASAPTSIGIVLPDDIRQQIGGADQGEVLSYLDDLLDEDVKLVNTYDILKEHRKEYVYFHSDHHWSALGAYYAYVAFCKTAGFEPVPLSNYSEINMGKFIGSQYYKVGNPSKLKTDELIAYAPPEKCPIKIYTSSGNIKSEHDDVIIDFSDKELTNKYNAFIMGDNPITVITNDSIEEGPKCILIKDSFGNPFSVYLSQHYSKVYVIDYRKVQRSILEYAKENDVDDIVICQSIGISQTARASGLLTQLLY